MASTVEEINKLYPEWNAKGMTWDDFGGCSEKSIKKLIKKWSVDPEVRVILQGIYNRYPLRQQVGLKDSPAEKKRIVEISIKENGKFLDVSGVPVQLKLRSRIGNYVYIRDCYEDLISDIVSSVPKKTCKAVAVLGTAGIGKSADIEIAF